MPSRDAGMARPSRHMRHNDSVSDSGHKRCKRWFLRQRSVRNVRAHAEHHNSSHWVVPHRPGANVHVCRQCAGLLQSMQRDERSGKAAAATQCATQSTAAFKQHHIWHWCTTFLRDVSLPWYPRVHDHLWRIMPVLPPAVGWHDGDVDTSRHTGILNIQRRRQLVHGTFPTSTSTRTAIAVTSTARRATSNCSDDWHSQRMSQDQANRRFQLCKLQRKRKLVCLRLLLLSKRFDVHEPDICVVPRGHVANCALCGQLSRLVALFATASTDAQCTAEW